MKKKISAIAAATALSVMMAIPAFASNYSGTYLYFGSNQSQAAPSHAQMCIDGVDTEDNGDGTTEVTVYVSEISHGGLVGEVSTMTIDGDKETPVDGEMVFDCVSNDLINQKGLVKSSITLSISNHPVQLSNVYLDLDE